MAPAPFSVLAINGGSSSIKFAVYPAGTLDKPIIFACHGHPLLIHRLTYRRTSHHNLHVRGYKEEGTAARRSRRRSGESARRNKT